MADIEKPSAESKAEQEFEKLHKSRIINGLR
jgi:hypothetical protein